MIESDWIGASAVCIACLCKIGRAGVGARSLSAPSPKLHFNFINGVIWKVFYHTSDPYITTGKVTWKSKFLFVMVIMYFNYPKKNIKDIQQKIWRVLGIPRQPNVQKLPFWPKTTSIHTIFFERVILTTATTKQRSYGTYFDNIQVGI